MHHHIHPSSVNNYRILRRMFALYRLVQQQEKFLQQHLPVLLEELAPGHAQPFSAQHIKRITKYWQLGLNLICENLYHLTGKQLNAGERHRIILLSVFGPLFDDLFDDKLLNHEQIAVLVENPEAYVASNNTDRLVLKLYLEILKLTPQRPLFIDQLKAVFLWQKESLKQLNAHITEEELYRITYNKSYYAVLLFCAVLDHYPSREIQDMLYPVAGLMQLTNDAFDVYKDVHGGVYTLPNLYRNFTQLQQHFMAEIASINHKLWQMTYPVKYKQVYAITIHSLHAMGWMALEQLKEVTSGINSIAALRTLGRKALICDMDSFQQKRKWLGHIRRLSNYYDLSSGLIKGPSVETERLTY